VRGGAGLRPAGLRGGAPPTHLYPTNPNPAAAATLLEHLAAESCLEGRSTSRTRPPHLAFHRGLLEGALLHRCPHPPPPHPPAAARKEYEIEARYESLDTLPTAATDVAKFALELRQHGRTMRAENWIIGLISFEILLSMYHIWLQHGAPV
jgi:hypothetical protein